MEVIAARSCTGSRSAKRVVPLLRKDIEVFEGWIAEGRIAPVNATHLLFAIWAMTQSYADFSAQMTLVLGKETLDSADFADAEKLITDMILKAVVPAQAGTHAELCKACERCLNGYSLWVPVFTGTTCRGHGCTV